MTLRSNAKEPSVGAGDGSATDVSALQPLHAQSSTLRTGRPWISAETTQTVAVSSRKRTIVTSPFSSTCRSKSDGGFGVDYGAISLSFVIVDGFPYQLGRC